MRKSWIAILSYLLTVSLIQDARAQSVPYKPGRYSWKLDGGEIQLVAARYTNRNSFDNRAYTFYFESNDRKHLYIIPVTRGKPGDTAFTTMSSAGGDWLLSDLAIQRKGSALYLINVRQETPGGLDEPGNLTVERFALKKGDEEDIPYQFVLQGKAVMQSAPRISVDEILKQQLKTTPK